MKRISPNGWRRLVLLGIYILGVVGARAGSAGMMARTWDQAVELPPGAYRAGKPIQMDGTFTVSIARGTYIEAIDFQGKEHDQTFKIEGALLRRAKLVGQLGFRVEAVDTAFDECELHRTGGWFVDYWGSHWKLDNCIVSRSFLLPEIEVANYAINAKNCTFLGVKMPNIKYKQDPSKYVQGKDLRFERCLFVECDIPQSLLAACVDCAFENCQFPSKKADLSGASQPIKVVAKIIGGGQVPQSILTNKLSVQFVPTGPGQFAAGSSLTYSSAGGRLTLSTVQIPQQFTMIGTTDKKASQIPDLGGTTAAGAQIPGGGSSTGTDPAAVRSVNDFTRGIPATVDLAPNGNPDPGAVDQANKELQQTFGGKPVALRVWLDDVRPTQDAGYAVRAAAREVPVLYRGLTIPVDVVLFFRPGEAAALSRVARGSDVSARGTVLKVELQGRGRGLAMQVTVGDTQVP
jgi:hypothetical protein